LPKFSEILSNQIATSTLYPWNWWSPINFFSRCLWLIDIKSVSISYDFIVLRVMVFNHQILPS